MATLDLRPLSLGELLDRTFTLYRSHFLLFIGIAAIPNAMIFAILLIPGLAPWIFPTPAHQNSPGGTSATSPLFIIVVILVFLAAVIVYLVAILWSQGATVIAVSELYLGRTTTIREAYRRVWRDVGTIFGVAVLSGLATAGGFILLIIPGIYIGCRLAAGVQAAVLEDIGPRDALGRSWELATDNVGRVFLIYVLYFVLVYAVVLMISAPFTFGAAFVKGNPNVILLLTILGQAGNFIAQLLVTPFITIAMSLFYYDMRVKKEGFDLQVMMNPLGRVAPAANAPPSMFS
ncbi:MAG: hypothetical protein ABSA32_11855 [Candidatus Acidiferrales bacterium]|jgi:hypothetical protein